jgi:hypothetical protein
MRLHAASAPCLLFSRYLEGISAAIWSVAPGVRGPSQLFGVSVRNGQAVRESKSQVYGNTDWKKFKVYFFIFG